MVDGLDEKKQIGPFFVTTWTQKSWNKQKREELRGRTGDKGKSGAGFT